MTLLRRLTKKLFLVSILAFALYVGMVLYYVFSSTEHLTRPKKAGGLFNNAVSVPQAFSPTALDSFIKTRTLNISTTHAPLKEILDRSYDQTDPGLKQSQPEVALKEECQENSSLLAGPVPLDLSIPKMDDIERQISREFDGWVSNGGIWRPTECEAKVKVAFIIPFRNRFQQLSIFLRHMHPLLKKQKLDYRIFVVEQSGDAPFNRAMLFNVGFKEALKFDEYKCFIFHDVDLLPEDYRNKYNCNSSPRHMANAMDKFHYRLPYGYFFGGVEALSREHFELINGFSNIFWGWGGEDDNLYFRVTRKGLKLTRPAVEIGRYKMIKEHHTVGERPPINLRLKRVRDALKWMDSDGLNSLQYNAKVIQNRLYTLIRADLPYEHHTQDNVRR